VKLHTRLLLALATGFVAGAIAHAYGNSAAIEFVGAQILRPIGQIFLRTIFMTVVPMVFAALVVGVYELGRERGLGGVAGRTLAFTLLLSAASVTIGVILVNVIRPGNSIRLQLPEAGSAGAAVQTLEANAAAAKPLSDVLIELIPRNPLDSAVRALDGEMLPLMVFALIFGFAISRAPGTGPLARCTDRHMPELDSATAMSTAWSSSEARNRQVGPDPEMRVPRAPYSSPSDIVRRSAGRSRSAAGSRSLCRAGPTAYGSPLRSAVIRSSGTAGSVTSSSPRTLSSSA